MGGTSSKPVAPSPSVAPVVPSGTSSTLRDTTLRSVIFGKRDVETTLLNDQVIVKSQVSPVVFESYINILKIMAQLSRLVYCDSGVIREVMMSPEFGTPDNKAVNSRITQVEVPIMTNKRIARTTYPQSKEGRPMESYVMNLSSQSGSGFATYISSPSDLTCVIVDGSVLLQKNSFFSNSDCIISFKGSSTIKNFKHDLYSQFTATDLASLVPGVSTTRKNYVAGSFVKPIMKSFDRIIQAIQERNPTRLFITGHSLGGAYATVFAFILAELKSRIPFTSIHLITFGSPTLLADGARNTFNEHLDSGFLTLDRVTSTGFRSKIADFIPGIPVGFSHPGFQPLRTELYPEKKTGRAYNIEMIRKVYQTGGVLGLGAEKTKYEADTKTHMPNKITVPAYTLAGNAFAHGEYLDMTWLTSMRVLGMKNPGFRGSDGSMNTFVAQFHDDGISFDYVQGQQEEVAAEADTQSADISGAKQGGKRKTVRRLGKRKTMRH